jgi:hypothetical protein
MASSSFGSLAGSLRQSLIYQPLARRPIHKAIKARQSMIIDVAFIQAERKFIDVTSKMFFAGMVIGMNGRSDSRVTSSLGGKNGKMPIFWLFYWPK